MIRLHLHGTIELQAADGRSLLSILSQPKRTALLAYLVVGDPGRFHRRDTLLGLFWPELDEQRARNALSQALHYLRRSLGEGVVVSRGEGEVGIAPGVLWCDTVAFHEALRAGRLEEALTLYRGEILAGLHLDRVPEFERWLDQVRAHARDGAARAAWQLADGAERREDLAAAVAWYRRAVGVQPDDESVLRRLLTFLDRTGDRTGALHLYESFARRIEDELGIEPSPRTLELIEEIKSRTGLADSAITPTVAPELSPEAELEPRPGAVSGAPPLPRSGTRVGMAVDQGVSPAGGEAPRRRRWYPLIVLVLVALGAIGGVIWTASERRAVEPMADPASVRAVAIFPFGVQGGEDQAYLGRGMTDLLSAKLDGAGGLRSVDPRAVLSAIAEGAPATPDLRRAGSISARLGADLFILGSLVAHGGRVQLNASLYQVGVEAPLVRATVEGAGEQLFDLVDRLTAELLVEQRRGPGAGLTHLAATTTRSLPALKAYLEGEDALRAGRYALAQEAFREAATLDTTFALAYYRLGVAAVWGEQGSRLPYWAVQQAIHHGDRLSERARLLLHAFRAFIDRDAVEAERLYRSVLATHPDDVEAWYHLGEVLFHYRPLLGSPLDESAAAFERVLYFEPGHGESLMHLARIMARRQEPAGLDSLVTRLLDDAPDRDRHLELRALQAAVRRDRGEWARLTGMAHQLGDPTLTTLLFATAAHGGDLGAALKLARLLTHPSRALSYRGAGYGMAAQIEAARGRWASARTELDELGRLEPTSALIIASLFAASPLTPATPAELEVLRSRTAELESEEASSSIRSMSIAPEYLPFLRHYLAGLLSVRLGDREGALAYGRTLGGLGGVARDPVLGPGLARSIDAASAWSAGDTAGALSALMEVPLGPHRLKAALGYSAQGYERFLFGEALTAQGRDDEALRWFASFPEPAGYDLIYLAPSHLRRAEIYDRQGDHDRAVFHYARFAELWEECDPELRPLVEAALERVAELTGVLAAPEPSAR